MKETTATAKIGEIFAGEMIDLYAALPLFSCPVLRPDLLASLPDARTALLFAVPYYSGAHPGRNISLYALPPDYHFYMKELGQRLIARLSALFPGARFAAFADHSPIDERIAAARAGLGRLGDNRLLITAPYGSYVFIGEIVSDLPPEALGAVLPREPEECLHCGACAAVCPGKGRVCAAGISQKKGELMPEEERLVLSTGLVWGCDLCQTVCPLNQNVGETPIAYFKTDLIERLDAQTLDALHGKEFRRRAFSWRGRQVLLRNIALYEREEKDK